MVCTSKISQSFSSAVRFGSVHHHFHWKSRDWQAVEERRAVSNGYLYMAAFRINGMVMSLMFPVCYQAFLKRYFRFRNQHLHI